MFLSSKKYSPQWFLKYLGQWSAIVWTTQSTKKGIKSIILRQNAISQHNVQSIICCSMNSTRHFSHTFFSDEKVHHIYLSLHYARESIENLNVFFMNVPWGSNFWLFFRWLCTIGQKMWWLFFCCFYFHVDVYTKT